VAPATCGIVGVAKPNALTLMSFVAVANVGARTGSIVATVASGIVGTANDDDALTLPSDGGILHKDEGGLVSENVILDV
jgi:hypothetical protein